MVEGKSGQRSEPPFAKDEEAEHPTESQEERVPDTPWADERKPPAEDDVKASITHKNPGNPPRKEEAAAPYGTDLPTNNPEGTNVLPVGKKLTGEVSPGAEKGNDFVPWGREDTKPLQKGQTPSLWAEKSPPPTVQSQAPWQRPDNADEKSSFSGKRVGVSPLKTKQDYGQELKQQMEEDARRRAEQKNRELEAEHSHLSAASVSGLSKGIGEHIPSDRA